MSSLIGVMVGIVPGTGADKFAAAANALKGLLAQI